MIRLLLIFLGVAGSAFASPNVLLIIADDFGVDSQSLYNPTAGATAPTPNLNGLAASGIRFTNAWACQVCSPTRACLITGRHGFRTGVGEAVSAAAANGLTAAELTLPEVISQSSPAGFRFNLGQYTTAASVEPTPPGFTPQGFSLSVPETLAATQTLWQSNGLDFWTPVPEVTPSRNDGQLTFTAPHSTSLRVFYSILTEVP